MAVSAVLNGAGSNVKVSKETAERIRDAARQLRYRPNTLARSLRNKRTGMVAVVFQHFDRFGDEHPYYPQLLNGVMAALFPADYTLALCPKLIQGDDAGSVSDGRFDGVLWCRPDVSEESVEGIQNSVVPVVMMHAPPNAILGVPTFCADNSSAMRTAVRHLAELGHKNVAFVIDPVNEHTVEGKVRAQAFLAAAQAARVMGDVFVWDPSLSQLEKYRQDAPHTGFVCFSDTLAGQILQACDRLGISVPTDLSVVGFDSSAFCEGTKPRLTSLNQPVERMAEAATNHLLSLIRLTAEGAELPSPVSYIYDCGLDVRDSTTGPRTHS